MLLENDLIKTICGLKTKVFFIYKRKIYLIRSRWLIYVAIENPDSISIDQIRDLHLLKIKFFDTCYHLIMT